MDDYGADNEVDVVGLGCSHERFVEWKEILELIEVLKEVDGEKSADGADLRIIEKSYDRFKYVVNQYKEQPHLLDPYLDKILDTIVAVVRGPEIPDSHIHRAFRYMHLVTNVRGFKRVLQFLPHDASDMDPILSMLEKQDETDINTWEIRYCLLLWLSIIVKIPFHLSKLDDTGISESETVTHRLVTICKKYIMVGDICRDACAYLTSQFLTRTDTKEKHLPEFVAWASEWIVQKGLNWKRFGPLAAVAAILKHGKRLDLLPLANPLLKTMLSMEWREEPYRLSRKFAVKIIQRIGLTYLVNRAVAWRYKRGARILPSVSEMISAGTGDCPKISYGVEREKSDSDEEEEEDQEVPAELDDIIEELFHGLRDRDITVRWSAAKGVGRVMSRMNKEFGDQVVGYVLNLLSPRERVDGWHGGCLALAELSKQGLLLPSRLPEVIPLVTKALVYDEPLGYASVGSHIRDAACYVCWTFARAYESNVFKPYVNDIATSLVTVFCLDREVNIRRAAAAAFQEHIGRQGTFPYGIEILTTADYFSVGVRTNAYLNISPFIAQYQVYTNSIIDHLVERKIEHWDIAIRDLSAKTLHNLTKHAPQYMLEIVLPALLHKLKTLDANARHGSIVSIGEVSHALSFESDMKLGNDVTQAIRVIVSNLRVKHQFRGQSGELMKVACCQMIHKCSLAKLPFHNDDVIDDWQQLLNECLCHEVGNIRNAAASALPALCLEYYQENGVRNTEKCGEIISNYTNKLRENDDITRVGHCLALGSIPAFMLDGYVDVAVNSLMKCSMITPETEKWVDSRKHAIKALTNICATVGVSDNNPKRSCRAHVLDLIECMIEGLNDYTRDDRGDTGAWVRESCMSGIQSILQLVAKVESSLLVESAIEKAMSRISQQAVERIDRTRALAGTVFAAILHTTPEIPFVPFREELVKIFPLEECKNKINWLSHADTFPRFTKLISLPAYTRSVLFGLIASIGGLTESLVKVSSSCFFDYLKEQNKDQLLNIGSLICTIYKDYVKVDRIVVPLLGFLDRLFSSGTIAPILSEPDCTFALEILELTKTACSGTTEKFKLLGSIDVYCHLIQVEGDVRKKSLGRIQILLCHRFGWLRKATANKFYEALMLYEDQLFNSSESSERALTILSETEWATIGIEEARSCRNKISEELGLQIPKLVSTSSLKS